MDGYTAFGASITYQGSKQTFNCPAPMAVVADLDVICAAPEEMNASGYADLLAKTTAGADWLVADALGVEAIDRTAWAIVQGGLREAVADPAGVRNRNPEAVRQLTEGLMLSGFAMQSATVQPARLRARNTSSATCGTCSTTSTRAGPHRTVSRSASARWRSPPSTSIC